MIYLPATVTESHFILTSHHCTKYSVWIQPPNQSREIQTRASFKWGRKSTHSWVAGTSITDPESDIIPLAHSHTVIWDLNWSLQNRDCIVATSGCEDSNGMAMIQVSHLTHRPGWFCLESYFGVSSFLFRSNFRLIVLDFLPNPSHSLNFFRIVLCLFFNPFSHFYHLIFCFIFSFSTLALQSLGCPLQWRLIQWLHPRILCFISFSILFLIILHWTHGFVVDTWWSFWWWLRHSHSDRILHTYLIVHRPWCRKQRHW